MHVCSNKNNVSSYELYVYMYVCMFKQEHRFFMWICMYVCMFKQEHRFFMWKKNCMFDRMYIYIYIYIYTSVNNFFSRPKVRFACLSKNWKFLEKQMNPLRGNKYISLWRNYVAVWTYIHTYMHTYPHEETMFLFEHTYIHTYLHIYMKKRCSCLNIHTYIHTYISIWRNDVPVWTYTTKLCIANSVFG